jgi:hypothetical protein
LLTKFEKYTHKIYRIPTKTGESLFTNLDTFINFYYDMLEDKPEKIIILDNACSNLLGDKTKEKDFKKKIEAFIEREKRSFNRSPIQRSTRSATQHTRSYLRNKFNK